MKKLFVSLLLFMPVFLGAQRLPLNFTSYGIDMCVAADQSVVLVSKVGEIGMGSFAPGSWRRTDLKNAGSLGSPILDQANFFNKDTGFVSGFINNDGKYNIIYRTTDGGSTWARVKFGQDGWVDAATNLGNGEAWLCVAGSGFAYTDDHGASWTKLKNPYIRERFTSIFFNPKREGIIGSLSNRIAYTGDNCKTWKLLPTPLDQHKYRKTNAEVRAELGNVAIFKEYFVIVQEGMVFYSKRDSIDWVMLPKYVNFFTDAENSAIYFRTRNDAYKANEELKEVCRFPLLYSLRSIKCSNGALFMLGDEELLCQVTPDEKKSIAVIIPDAAAGINPESLGYSGSTEIGMQGRKIFRKTVFDGPWEYMFTFPLPLENAKLRIIENNLFLHEAEDELSYIDFKGKLKKKVSRKKMLEEFIESSITGIIFSAGTSGCFYSSVNTLFYTNDGDSFGGAIEQSADKKGMPDSKDEIAISDVNDFLHLLPGIVEGDQGVTIKDLEFTEKEYDKCKADIELFRQQIDVHTKAEAGGFYMLQNNIDFDLLHRLVDSVKTINDLTLGYYLSTLSEFTSTSSFWKSVELQNERGETLTIQCRYFEESPFLLPWRISFKGYSIHVPAFSINRFIQKVYPAFLTKEGRVQVLHGLVKRLYADADRE